MKWTGSPQGHARLLVLWELVERVLYMLDVVPVNARAETLAGIESICNGPDVLQNQYQDQF